ncbi:hypothetical protein L1049_017811 [Liquidambar formosana]|uniref:Uncharacterized protein n=1 Tax=Liquidambar formosana TaxID=63359 RepID=A0AAP0NMM1_LIQFO
MANRPEPVRVPCCSICSLPTGYCQCVMWCSNCGLPAPSYESESVPVLYCSRCDLLEECCDYGPDEFGPDECGPDECGSDDCGPDECGSDECGPNECGPDFEKCTWLIKNTPELHPDLLKEANEKEAVRGLEQLQLVGISSGGGDGAASASPKEEYGVRVLYCSICSLPTVDCVCEPVGVPCCSICCIPPEYCQCVLWCSTCCCPTEFCKSGPKCKTWVIRNASELYLDLPEEANEKEAVRGLEQLQSVGISSGGGDGAASASPEGSVEHFFQNDMSNTFHVESNFTLGTSRIDQRSFMHAPQDSGGFPVQMLNNINVEGSLMAEASTIVQENFMFAP